MKIVATMLIAFAIDGIVPAQATPFQIADGTVSAVATFNPAVAMSNGTSTFAAANGTTYEVSASGGFQSARGGTGILNGTLTFSGVTGKTLVQQIPAFFTFADGQGGSFDFSVASVLTRSFADDPGISSSGSLYVLGTTVDAFLGDTAPTSTSLTVSFTSTGGSPYSSSFTLAVPPGPLPVPEPASLMLLGGGLAMIGLLHAKSSVPFHGIRHSASYRCRARHGSYS